MIKSVEKLTHIKCTKVKETVANGFFKVRVYVNKIHCTYLFTYLFF